MKLTILGCGTSTGVPVIGCGCEVCASSNQRNKRTRSSAFIETGTANILIDTSTDLRAQALANNINRVDAVLFTHAHADHIHGIDDLRAFNIFQKTPIPCYGSSSTLERIRTLFGYIFDESPESWSFKPDLTLNPLDATQSAIEINGARVVPFDVIHGPASIHGFRIGDLAYATDCSSIPKKSMDALAGVKLLVLGALRHKPHPTHFSVDQAIEVGMEIKAELTVLTHLGHGLDYATDGAALPKGFVLAYDGMSVEV